MARPEKFQKDLAGLAKRIAENADKTLRRAALTAHQVVTVSTPVDTGRARSNWQVEIDKPAEGVVGPLDTSGQTALSLGRTAVARFRLGVNRAIHLTNNLPYIGLLDKGSSAQAPSGMTRKAIQAAREVVRRAKLVN